MFVKRFYSTQTRMLETVLGLGYSSFMNNKIVMSWSDWAKLDATMMADLIANNEVSAQEKRFCEF